MKSSPSVNKLPIISSWIFLLQFAPDNSQNLMITSADSTVHILDGVDAKKFHGRPSFINLSFTLAYLFDVLSLKTHIQINIY